MTSHNVESCALYGNNPIIKEHEENNQGVQSTLIERGIIPEDLPPAEDTKKLERRIKADERKLKKILPWFLGMSRSQPSPEMHVSKSALSKETSS